MNSHVNIQIGSKDLKRIISAILIAVISYHYGASSDVTSRQPSVVQQPANTKQTPHTKTPPSPKNSKAC